MNGNDDGTLSQTVRAKMPSRSGRYLGRIDIYEVALGKVIGICRFEVSVDGKPPRTRIEPNFEPPLTNLVDISFELSADEPTSRFECMLEPAWSSWSSDCGSTRTFGSLSEGTYKFSARAVDAVSNVDPSPAEINFTIDRTPPQFDISIEDISRGEGQVTVTLQGSDIQNEPGLKIQCGTDALNICSTRTVLPRTGCFEGTGRHTLTAVVTDRAGNSTTNTRQLSITDGACPSIALTDAPPTFSRTRSASFAWSATQGATVTCSIDSAKHEDFGPCESDFELGQGLHTFRIKTVEPDGDEAVAYKTWRIDLTKPRVTLASESSGSRRQSTTIKVKATDNHKVASRQCVLRRPGTSKKPGPCQKSSYRFANISPGEWVFLFIAADRAGNRIQRSVQWEVCAKGYRTDGDGCKKIPKKRSTGRSGSGSRGGSSGSSGSSGGNNTDCAYGYRWNGSRCVPR